MTADSLPLSFRSIEVDRIMSIVKAGDSCFLVGIGSFGKSNLLRFLQREDVRRSKLGVEWDNYVFVYIDANKLLEQTDWGLFELMLHQLLAALSRKEITAEVMQPLGTLYGRATEQATRYLALRYLDQAVSLICGRLGLRLVLLLDEFDHLWRTLPPQTFTALRALRDDNKYFLMFVIAARNDLRRLSSSESDIEAFEELVTQNIIGLTAYSEDDARSMLRRLAERHNAKVIEEPVIRQLLEKTGGHPGLIRAVFDITSNQSIHPDDLRSSEKKIQDECRRIWRSLADDEQIALTNIAVGNKSHATSQSLMSWLRMKGLIGGKWARPDQVFSTLLSEYILSERPLVGARIYVDREKHAVYVDDRQIPGLAPLEYNLIEYLDGRRGQVVTRDEIIAHLYPDTEVADGINDNRVDSIVKRLRRALEPDPNEPRFILTVRGHGLKLEDGAPVKKQR